MIPGIYFDGKVSTPREAYFRFNEFTYEVLDRFQHVIDEQANSPGINSYKPGIFLDLDFASGAHMEFRREHCKLAFSLISKKEIRLIDRVTMWFTPARALGFLAVVILILYGLYRLTTSEVLISRIAGFISKEAEISMGQKVADQYLETTEADTDASQTLTQFYETLNLDVHYDMHLYFVKDSTVNAFAMPGGFIFVHQGLLDRMDNFGELAAVLAHESMHIEDRHSLKTLVRSVIGYVMVSILVGDVSGIGAILAENANTLRNLSYSRNYESASDAGGMQLLCDGGVDPSGMIGLFQSLDAYEKEVVGDSGVSRLDFIRTHPVNKKRIESAENFVSTHSCMVEAGKLSKLQTLFDQLKSQEAAE